MKKKILISLLAVVVIVGGTAALSAWEAHVINVIARIENALSVSTKEIAFGTVFPQEFIEEEFTINLSSSFLTENKADDVEYIIKQKPKPLWPILPECEPLYDDPETTIEEARAYCHDYPEDLNCCYLSLCPFLSKLDGDPEDKNDIGVPSYYQGTECVAPDPEYAIGRLAKSEGDTSDIWKVDLKVPPVAGYVGQDWPFGCPVVSEDSQEYGCDLWVEVTGISRIEGSGPGECEPGTQRACSTGELGICSTGTQSCNLSGYWDECIPENSPVTEICDDGLDNDCDGLTDCDDEEDCAEDPYCYNTSDALANAGWQYRKKITIDSTKIDSNLSDFPVLVKLTSSNFDFSKARSDGHDIRFAQSDGTILLKYERERHDSASQKAEYWVKAPSVSSIGDTEFYMYYGKSGASDGADPINVWDSNFGAVWHLNENSGTRSDATTNGVDLTDNNTVGVGVGKIANGGDFEATNAEYLSHSTFLDTFPAGATFEAWIKPETVNVTQVVIQKTNVPLEDRMKLLANSSNTIAYLTEGQNAGTVVIGSSNTVTTGTWYYIAGTWAADDYPKVYLNTAVNTASTTVPQIQNGTWKDFTVGVSFSEPSTTPAYYFDGVVDEVRVSNIARPAAWLKASYNSGNDSLLTFGSEESI